MVDFDKDRDANLAAFELTGGAAANGLTVRDYFAARVAVQMFSECVNDLDCDWDYGSVSESAYRFADAMMQAREIKPQQKAVSVEEAFGLEK